MIQWKCVECNEIIQDADVLHAPNPFNAEERLVGCPQCKAAESLLRACDRPGCTEGFTCAWADGDEYRVTCYQHSKWGLNDREQPKSK